MDLSTWVDPDAHGWIVQPTSEDDWTALLDEYGGKLLLPLARVIEVVRLSGCRSVVIENRYVDIYYRSEHSAFWCHRTAEGTAHFILRVLGSNENAHPRWKELASKVATKDVSLRTILCNASDYKSLSKLVRWTQLLLGYPTPAAAPLRVGSRGARPGSACAGDPSVVAEVVFDSTSSDITPRYDALLMPLLALTYPADGGDVQWVETDGIVWRSVLPNIPELPAHLRAAS